MVDQRAFHRHTIELSCGTVLVVSEQDLLNIERYKEEAQQNKKRWQTAEEEKRVLMLGWWTGPIPVCPPINK